MNRKTSDQIASETLHEIVAEIRRRFRETGFVRKNELEVLRWVASRPKTAAVSKESSKKDDQPQDDPLEGLSDEQLRKMFGKLESD